MKRALTFLSCTFLFFFLMTQITQVYAMNGGNENSNKKPNKSMLRRLTDYIPNFFYRAPIVPLGSGVNENPMPTPIAPINHFHINREEPRLAPLPKQRSLKKINQGVISPLETLPPDALRLIFDYLDTTELDHFFASSNRFRALAKHILEFSVTEKAVPLRLIRVLCYKAPNLQKLTLSDMGPSEICFSHNQSMPKSRSYFLLSILFQAFFEKEFLNLTHLDISGAKRFYNQNYVYSLFLNAIRKGHLKSLIRLNLKGTEINEDHRKIFFELLTDGEMPKLKELHIDFNVFDYEPYKTVLSDTFLNQLEFLDEGKFRFMICYIEYLHFLKSSKLKSINIEIFSLPFSEIKNFSFFTSLRKDESKNVLLRIDGKIEYCHTEIINFFDSNNNGNFNLTHLIYENGSSRNFVDITSGINSGKMGFLQSLLCSLDCIDDSQLSMIIQGISNRYVPFLSELNISRNNFSDTVMADLINALANNLPNFNTLKMDSCNARDKSIKALGKALKQGKLKKLTTLSLAENDSTESSLIKLAKAIRDAKLLHLSFFKISEISQGDHPNKSTMLVLQEFGKVISSQSLPSLKTFLIRPVCSPHLLEHDLLLEMAEAGCLRQWKIFIFDPNTDPGFINIGYNEDSTEIKTLLENQIRRFLTTIRKGQLANISHLKINIYGMTEMHLRHLYKSLLDEKMPYLQSLVFITDKVFNFDDFKPSGQNEKYGNVWSFMIREFVKFENPENELQ